MLFLVPYAPTRIRTRPYHFVRALADAGHRVTVATVWRGEEERDAVEALRRRLGPDAVLAERLPVPRSLLNCLRALPTHDPLQAHYSWSPALARRVTRHLQLEGGDVVHVEHLRGARYGLALGKAWAGRPDRPALVWDAVDCISTLFQRAAAESATRRVRTVARLELPRTRRYEAAATRRFDRVVVTSSADRREILALASSLETGATHGSRVDVVTNGVDLEYFTPGDEPRDRTSVVVTAKMSYHANVTAVLWLAHEVMPHVWRRDPTVTLRVVGQGPPSEVTRLVHRPPAPGGRVEVTGTVDDVRPYLRRAAVAVAPIRYSVGVQNKVLEALACATPVVATPQAVAALDAAALGGVVTSDSATGMAASLVALLADPARREALGRAGRGFVERRHAWSAIADRLTETYTQALQEPRVA